MSLFPPKTFKRFQETVFNFSCGVLLIVPFLSFLVTIQLPIFLYRLILTKWIASRFHPRIGKAVTIPAQFMATEFLNSDTYCRYGVIAKLVLRGVVTKQELQKLILDRWIQGKRVGANGTEFLRYPEFQQHIESWMGFMFWKQDQNFSLDNHIIYHELDNNLSAEISEKSLDDIVEDPLNKSFSLGTSPWEMHLIRNFKSTELEDEQELSVLVLRVHHVLSDAFSMTHAIVKDPFCNKVENVRVLVPRNTGNRNAQFVGMLVSPFRFLTDLGYVLTMLVRKQFPWRYARSQSSDLESSENERRARRKICHKSPLISLEKLKFIKNSLQVPLSAVLYSSVSAALAKSFPKPQDTTRISIIFPKHRDGGPNKLRNIVTPALLELNTDNRCRPQERLLAVAKDFTELKRSFVPLLLSSLTKIFSGSLASSFARIARYRASCPVVASNFPGPAVNTGLDKVRQMVGLDTYLGTSLDVAFVMCSYNGHLRLALMAENSVLDRAQLEKMVGTFCAEINFLYELAKDTAVASTKYV